MADTAATAEFLPAPSTDVVMSRFDWPTYVKGLPSSLVTIPGTSRTTGVAISRAAAAGIGARPVFAPEYVASALISETGRQIHKPSAQHSKEPTRGWLSGCHEIQRREHNASTRSSHSRSGASLRFRMPRMIHQVNP
jgi:hypothetical protein